MQAFAKTINKTTQPNRKKNLTADEVKVNLLAEDIAKAKEQAKKEIVQKKGYRYK